MSRGQVWRLTLCIHILPVSSSPELSPTTSLPAEKTRPKVDAAGTVHGPMAEPNQLARRHIRLGLWWLLVFAAGGLVLESLHGLKLGLYLDVGNQTRRHMWTLAHAHGTLLGLVHLAYAAILPQLHAVDDSRRARASALFTAAGICLPGGFFLGGLWFYAGDPGLGIVLVPIGAFALIWGCWVLLGGLPKPPKNTG